MVSTNSNPPMPMPMTVPAGHMVQQILDQNGTLQDVILALDPMAPPPPGPAAPAAGPPTAAGAATATTPVSAAPFVPAAAASQQQGAAMQPHYVSTAYIATLFICIYVRRIELSADAIPIPVCNASILGSTHRVQIRVAAIEPAIVTHYVQKSTRVLIDIDMAQ